MLAYCMRRLLLLPVTLFSIVLVNFGIVNLAPGDPITMSQSALGGDVAKADNRSAFIESDEQYLHFREFFGLTLPLFFNTWVWNSQNIVEEQIDSLIKMRATSSGARFQEVNDLKRAIADQSAFIMPHLLTILKDQSACKERKELALHFFLRGGQKIATLGPVESAEDRAYNQAVNANNRYLDSFKRISNHLDAQHIADLEAWYQNNKLLYQFEPNVSQKIGVFFLKTRLCRYLKRVVTLDFGVLRNDPNRTVISEVIKRMKYSITLAIIPMVCTFFLCLFFGFWMAIKANTWQDHVWNFIFLVLYSAPVFVVAPFLIETCALHKNYPGSSVPFPISGFSSSPHAVDGMTSLERLQDILRHLTLPFLSLFYGSLAVQSRFARSAFLDILNQDYIRTAWAKGLSPSLIYVKHVGRNASITLLTSIAGSLGVILGGSLIIETIFSIPGFGKFFYDAILARDYNVIMFSALAGSFLTLVGYLFADLVYMILDPRVSLE